MTTLVIPPRKGKTVSLGGFGAIFKISGDFSEGRFSIVEHPIDPGRSSRELDFVPRCPRTGRAGSSGTRRLLRQARRLLNAINSAGLFSLPELPDGPSSPGLNVPV